MKHFILTMGCLLIFATSLNAQIVDKINFQTIIRNSSGELLAEGTIGIRFQILQGTAMGSMVFEESHTVTTTILGLATVKIGGGTVSLGSLNTIDWANGPYYVNIEIDPTGGSNYTLQNTSLLNSVPLAASTLKSAMALTADYSTLTNLPIIITSDQIDLLGYITLTNAIDLDAIKTQVDLNSQKAFPGFGTTSGTAVEVLWTQNVNDVFYPNGNIGIGTNTNLDTSSAVLNVEGGVLYNPTTNIFTEIGALKYLNIGVPSLNDFYYGDNLANFNLFKSNPDTDIVFLTDVNIVSNLGIGESMTTNYNFGDNNLVIASSNPGIRFQDTSSTSSFPTADWSIKINDETALGDSYFSISNFTTGDSTFKIMAGASTGVFNILANGNVGINTLNPTVEIEVSNIVTATGLVGDISGLTNIPTVGTASTSNTGSTTIKADSNSDTIGSIIFNTQAQDQIVIKSNGNTGIGVPTPTVTLDVDGDLIADVIDTQNLIFNGIITIPITLETPPDYASIDVAGKNTIIMNPTSPVNYYTLLNGTNGQIVTFINSGIDTITFLSGSIFTPGLTPIILQQNESLRLVNDGGIYLTLDLVN